MSKRGLAAYRRLQTVEDFVFAITDDVNPPDVVIEALLDAMDYLWYSLSDTERELLNTETDAT